MKKHLTFAALVCCLGSVGCSQALPPVTQAEPAGPLLVNAIADLPAAKVDVPAKVKYVAQTKKWGTLRAKFVVDGKVADVQKINAAADPICAAFPIMSENLIIGKDGALKNLAIFMDKKSKTKDVHPDLVKPAAAPVVLDNKNCVFVPHVLMVRPGQTVSVTNSDSTGHNANFNFFNNQAVNFLVPANGNKNLEIVTDEPAPIPVECNVHPWMKAHLIVQDHPYVGISGEDGVLEIANLPVGDVTLRVWHETGTIDSAIVGGKAEKWSRGRMELAIKEGMNDLGTVKISADAFKKK